MNRERNALRITNGEAWATDDVTGGVLDSKTVINARVPEMPRFLQTQPQQIIISSKPNEST